MPKRKRSTNGESGTPEVLCPVVGAPVCPAKPILDHLVAGQQEVKSHLEAFDARRQQERQAFQAKLDEQHAEYQKKLDAVGADLFLFRAVRVACLWVVGVIWRQVQKLFLS